VFHKSIFRFLSHGLHKSDFRDFVVRTVSLNHSSLEFFCPTTASFQFQVFVLRTASISPVSIVPVLRAASFKFQVSSVQFQFFLSYELYHSSFKFLSYELHHSSFKFLSYEQHPSVQFQFFLSYELYHSSFKFLSYELHHSSFKFLSYELHPSVQFQFFLSYELYPLAAVYFNFV
jgi:hypothetical protein